MPTTTAIDYDWEEAVRHLRTADPRFGAVIDARPDPLVLTRARSPLDALIRAVIYQQLSTKAAATIHGRFLDLFPRRRPTAAAIDQTTDEAIRGAGLSAGKLRAVRDLACFSREGRLPGYAELGRLTDEEVIARLTAVHGVGVWTVEMLLIFQLGRADVLPVGDLGVRKGFARLRGRGGEVTPAQLTRAAKKWRPYRSVASWYCYRALEI